jgi:serine/threonine-protein kinase RsbW
MAGEPVLAHADADTRETAELVLAEVLNNVAEHAYGGRRGQVWLRLRLSERGIVCRVADRGTGMPHGRLPDPAAQGPDPADLPQGGFGWPLIRMLTRGLRYRRVAGCNVVVFTVPRNS